MLKSNTINKLILLIKILGALAIIQIIRIIIIKVSFIFLEKTSLNNTIINSIVMVIFTIGIIICSKKNKINLSIIINSNSNSNSNKSKIIYYVFTAATIFLIVSAPIFIGDYTMSLIIPLIYSTIVVTIFEEILFRGYIWNYLKRDYKNEFAIYIITTMLFAIWHLGYFDSIILNMSINNLTGNMLFVMLMKVVTGLVFGIVIGFIRYKTKNTYAAILTHSIMNIFGR